MSHKFLVALLALALGACQHVPATSASRGTSAPPVGTYDNHEQVWAAGSDGSVLPPPRVEVRIAGTALPGWSVWQVRYGATPPIEATWAMQRMSGAGEGGRLVPHRLAAAAPALKFDPTQWVALDACALRGAVDAASAHVQADVASCAALVPGIGAAAALLPLAVEQSGEWLRVRFHADQARGAAAREDLRRVQVFEGWAAINGSGPNGVPGADWHMNRNLRLGNEGSRVPLAWRDGAPSGWSLDLARLTYRDGNVPVLKLSVIDDASGRTLAYAWANPEATHIGINLGWLQVGLQREAGATQQSPEH